MFLSSNTFCFEVRDFNTLPIRQWLIGSVGEDSVKYFRRLRLYETYTYERPDRDDLESIDDLAKLLCRTGLCRDTVALRYLFF